MKDTPSPPSPFVQFDRWFHEAEASSIEEANAFVLSTVNAQGRPSSRVVLLKSHDEAGFVFYTNLKSHKGRDLEGNPYAAICFFWPQIDKQVRIEGRVQPVSAEEADAYFASRPRGSRIGAWASRQSEKMSDKHELERRLAHFIQKFPLQKIPRPQFWSGFRLVPDCFEFWQRGRWRLHRRESYERREDGTWQSSWLFP